MSAPITPEEPLFQDEDVDSDLSSKQAGDRSRSSLFADGDDDMHSLLSFGKANGTTGPTSRKSLLELTTSRSSATAEMSSSLSSLMMSSESSLTTDSHRKQQQEEDSLLMANILGDVEESNCMFDHEIASMLQVELNKVRPKRVKYPTSIPPPPLTLKERFTMIVFGIILVLVLVVWCVYVLNNGTTK